MTGRSVSSWLRTVLASLIALAGCGNERTQSVTFTVAAPSDSADCNAVMTIADPCTTVMVFDSETGEQLGLVDVSDPERKTSFKLQFEGNAEPRFDVPLEPGQRVDVRVVVYENDGAARYGAFVEDVDPTAGPVSIRLYPFRQWACGGDRPSVPRALHGAELVNADQVLIFGGVQGFDLDALSLRDPEALGGPTLVDTIEVYDGRTHSFENVTIVDPAGLLTTGEDGSPRFRRVLFDSVIAEEPADPESVTRVRVIGGYTGEGPMLHFDNLGTRGARGAPFVPARDAQTALTMDLVYDPAGPTVTVEDAAFAMTTARGGPIHMGDFYGTVGPTDPALVVISLAPDAGRFAPTANVFSYTREGEAADTLRVLMNVRLGPAVLTVRDGFLVWGGNVGAADPRTAAGELFPPREDPSVLVPAPASAPPATSFHSWTRTGDDQFLIAGGYVLSADPDGLTMFNQVPAQPIYYLEVAEGGAVDARIVDAPGYASTIFHTSTSIPEVGVLLVGGAGVEPAGAMVGTGNRLAPQDQAVVVAGARYTPFPDLGIERWGHTTTVLSGHRVLVVGGFGRDALGMSPNAMRALPEAELMYWDEAPRDLLAGECEMHVEEPIDGAVEREDAGLPPIGDAGVPVLPDAGPGDAGPDAMVITPADAGFDSGL